MPCCCILSEGIERSQNLILMVLHECQLSKHFKMLQFVAVISFQQFSLLGPISTVWSSRYPKKFRDHLESHHRKYKVNLNTRQRPLSILNCHYRKNRSQSLECYFIPTSFQCLQQSNNSLWKCFIVQLMIFFWNCSLQVDLLKKPF